MENKKYLKNRKRDFSSSSRSESPSDNKRVRNSPSPPNRKKFLNSKRSNSFSLSPPISLSSSNENDNNSPYVEKEDNFRKNYSPSQKGYKNRSNRPEKIFRDERGNFESKFRSNSNRYKNDPRDSFRERDREGYGRNYERHDNDYKNTEENYEGRNHGDYHNNNYGRKFGPVRNSRGLREGYGGRDKRRFPYEDRKNENNFGKDFYNDREDRNKEDESEETRKRGMLSYKDFLSKQRDDITPEEAQKLYEQYKKEFQLSNSKIFFKRHKDEEWFKEKYNPADRLSILKFQIENSKESASNFLNEIRSLCSDKISEINENGEEKVNERVQQFVSKYALERDIDAFKFIRKFEKKSEAENEKERVKEIEKGLYDERQRNCPGSESEGEDKKENEPFSARDRGPLDHEDNFCDENSVFIFTIPLQVKRKQLSEVFEKIEGFVKICLSEPIPKYAMNRFAWVTFESQEGCQKALELNGFKINFSDEHQPLYLHILPKKKSSKCVEPAHFYTLFEKRIDADIEQSLKVIEKISERNGYKEYLKKKDLEIFKNHFFDGSHKLIILNLLITYLQHVHNFCYYCGVDYITEEGLMSRCKKIHPRNTIIDIENERNFRFSNSNNAEEDSSYNDYKNWERNFDEKISHFLDYDDNKKILNWFDRKEKEITKEMTTDSKNNRFKCKKCDKVFVAEKFIEKHIKTRHQEDVEEDLKRAEEEQFFRNYQLDSERFLLENVETVIPGDVTNEFKNKNMFMFRKPPIMASETTNERRGLRGPQTGRFMGQKRGFDGKRRNFGMKSQYVDWDKPAGEGEEDIDYGLAAESTAFFRV